MRRAGADGERGAGRPRGRRAGGGEPVSHLLPDAIPGEHLFHLVDAAGELRAAVGRAAGEVDATRAARRERAAWRGARRARLLAERGDVIAEAEGEVGVDASGADVGGVHPRARDALVELHQLLALLEPPEHRRERADVHRVARDGEQVVEDPRDLEEHRADHLRAARHRRVRQRLHRHRVPLLLRHHRDVVEAVEVRQRLLVVLVLDQLLGAAVEEADVRVGALDHLAVELEDEAQHAVRRRVLRAEVEREVLDLHLVGVHQVALHRRALVALRHRRDRRRQRRLRRERPPQ